MAFPNDFRADLKNNGFIDLWGSASIGWFAGIYPDARTVLKLGLYHVRAADDIEIEYNSERDGWVIYRTVTVGWTEPTPEKNYYESIEKRKEVAFIPAWDEEEVSEPDQETDDLIRMCDCGAEVKVTKPSPATIMWKCPHCGGSFNEVDA